MAAVIDLFSHQVVGWSLRVDMAQGIVIDTLRMARFRRHPSKQAELTFHSDGGSHYASQDLRHVLTEHGIIGLMVSCSGCCNNARYETLFASLRVERLHGLRFVTRHQAQDEAISWLLRYNRPDCTRGWPTSTRCGLSKIGLRLRPNKSIRDSAMGCGFRRQDQSAQFTIVGIDAVDKAQCSVESVLKRTSGILEERGLGDYAATHVEVLGAEARSVSGFGDRSEPSGKARTVLFDFEAHSPAMQRKSGQKWTACPTGAVDWTKVRQAPRVSYAGKVKLRLTAIYGHEEALEFLGCEVTAIRTSFTPGVTEESGCASASALVHQCVFLLDKPCMGDHLMQMTPACRKLSAPSSSATTPRRERPSCVRGLLIRFAWGRSSNKGDNSNFGSIAPNPDLLFLLCEQLSGEATIT